MTLLSLSPLLLLSSPSCNATGMSCACAQGLIVVAVVRHNRHVVRLCTRPCRHCHRATQPACCALAHKAISLLPLCDVTDMPCACRRGLIVVAVVRCNQHVMRLHTRPCRCRPCVTQPACLTLAHKAISLLPLCNLTSMSCACAQGLIIVACLATCCKRDCRQLC